MQLLQPMQMRRSPSTMPSGRFESAPVGQIVTHGAAVHWLQRRTAKERLTAGNSPASVYLTQVRKLPTGTWFSLLHATVQAWQPMHFEWSMTKPSCTQGASGRADAMRAAGAKPGRGRGSAGVQERPREIRLEELEDLVEALVGAVDDARQVRRELVRDDVAAGHERRVQLLVAAARVRARPEKARGRGLARPEVEDARAIGR